jgi:hypothetical protein
MRDTISVRLSREELSRIEAAARTVGLGKTVFLRVAGLSAARGLLNSAFERAENQEGAPERGQTHTNNRYD